MENHQTCPHCGAALNQNGLCRACLEAEAERLLAQLTDSEIAEIMENVSKPDTRELGGNCTGVNVRSDGKREKNFDAFSAGKSGETGGGDCNG